MPYKRIIEVKVCLEQALSFYFYRFCSFFPVLFKVFSGGMPVLPWHIMWHGVI